MVFKQFFLNMLMARETPSPPPSSWQMPFQISIFSPSLKSFIARHSCHLGKSTQLSTQIKTYASTAYFVDAGADAAVVYTPCYYKVFSLLMLCFLFQQDLGLTLKLTSEYTIGQHKLLKCSKCPPYQAKMTSTALEKHFIEVADASPIPIVLYR